jgi:hypothetical protein
MKKFHVSIAVQILEIYEIEAEDAEIASDCWSDGDLIYTEDEALDSTVLTVKEV